MMEGVEDVGSALVAHREPAQAGEPGEGSLHHPPMPTQALAAVDPAPGDPWGDAAAMAGLAAAAVVVGLVGVQLARSSARPPRAPPDRRHGVERRLQQAAVVDVGPAQGKGERDAVRVDENVTLAARLGPVGRVRAGEFAPLLAATAALSSEHRPQSMALALPSRSSSTRCRRSHTPATCQSRRRRQQVMPDRERRSRSPHLLRQHLPSTVSRRWIRSAQRARPDGREGGCRIGARRRCR